MPNSDYYFFVDANQPAPGATDYIKVQTSAGAYGPISPGMAGTDEYRVTSVHTASFNPTAYAACDGIVCVQRIPNTTPPLVNIILRPLVQPALNFAPVKYIIYKGILESSLINGPEVASPGNNELTKFVWREQAKKNISAVTIATPPAEALGIDLTAAAGPDLADAESIDNLFYRTGVSFQLPTVKGGWSIGQFDKSGFGLEVLMEGLGFHHSLALARQLENRISVGTLTGSETLAQLFDQWHAKEQVLGFMDPCAFYGSFFLGGIQAKTSSDTESKLKAGNALYYDVLFPFANHNTAYLDIRNEHNYSFNYFGNYDKSIQLSYDPASVTPTPVDYYASKWPLLTFSASSFPATNTNTARNAFRIQLPVGDNPEPLVYVSQGYRDINSKGDGFPAELTSAEQFYDAFEPPEGVYTATKGTSGLNSMTFVVPNVTGQAATTIVSCYIRLKYFKQQPGTTGVSVVSTVIQSANYLDNVIYPLDLRILFKGNAVIKTAIYEEEIYVNAQSAPGLKFDFVGKVGIARDADNTTIYLIPTNVRKSAGKAAAPVTLSAQTSDYSGSYLDLIAAQYPLERVRQSNLLISPTVSVPIAEFVSDGAAGGFTLPDFSKLIAIVVNNATFDYWRNDAVATLDRRFRTYLGVINLQTQTDTVGAQYISFDLVLRGFEFDASTSSYKVKELNTDPAIFNNNVKVYTHVETKPLAVTSLTLLDINNEALRFLSATPHTYFGGNTRIHGTVTVEGSALDTLQSLVLEVLQGGAVVATGTLVPTPAASLLVPFGIAERVVVAQRQLLFNIPSNQLNGINASQDGTLGLRVRAQSANGQEATRSAQTVQILARYTGNNRFGVRDEAVGGDDWARPSVLAVLAQPVGVSYGDMSNMNGGLFAPHASHGDGLDVDGSYPGYNARNAATAQTMIGHLNSAYGSSIIRVFVTYTASPANAFFQAIQGVVLNDGRLATDVIRPVVGHDTHFHWRFGP